ncbi:hypothetical protein L6452_07926 [Arctium lappa]|uniref:Uncharacterized protein n=1 Tax=Arctium lappa TaxID=4217 RepID=A0ACB9EMC9_ARCLA|nr:hypothetical protein L6452_07926 [Arctium lappa]
MWVRTYVKGLKFEYAHQPKRIAVLEQKKAVKSVGKEVGTKKLELGAVSCHHRPSSPPLVLVLSAHPTKKKNLAGDLVSPPSLQLQNQQITISILTF